jgi:ABC-type phosphate/phosphonate transport system substrate-binding protein
MPINSIVESDGLIAAVNTINSNSGMNVLRHEIEKINKLGAIEQFFKELKISGSHNNSLQYLIDEKADIASIDAASYYFLQRNNPELNSQLKVIGRSVKTTSPPFVTHGNNPLCGSIDLMETLNKALIELPSKHQEILNIERFVDVSLSDYEKLLYL